jgi:hypothetical protein
MDIKYTNNNPYKGTGVPAENWQRGYDGNICLAAKGSDAYTFWLEGKKARESEIKDSN